MLRISAGNRYKIIPLYGAEKQHIYAYLCYALHFICINMLKSSILCKYVFPAEINIYV